MRLNKTKRYEKLKKKGLRYSLYLLLLTCTLARGQESNQMHILIGDSDTIFIQQDYPQDYIIPTITREGEKGFMVVGDTVKAVLNEIERLERENESLKIRLDDCWESAVSQAEKNRAIFKNNLDILEGMLNIIEE